MFELDFSVFLLLAEHAGTLVSAMKSALADFEVNLCLVSSRHQILKNFLYTFEFILGKTSSHFNETSLKFVFDMNCCTKWVLNMCFLDFEAFLGVPGEPWKCFLGVLGLPFGIPKRVQNRAGGIPISLRPASLVPNGLWKVSLGDFYWFLKGSGPFRGGFGRFFFWKSQIFGLQF